MAKQSDIEILKLKLEELSGIWIDYFYTYPYFHSHIKFTEEEKSNYVGVLFGHFSDLFDVVFPPIDEFVDYSEAYRFYISLFQGMYVQQDFIEELLIIFRTGIQRGELDNNPDFKLNRDIRNEFVGHPISRDKSHNLTSSSIIGFDSNSNQLCYLKYKFPIEGDVVQKISTDDIINRHVSFLNKYFDVLLEKSYELLRFFENNILDKIIELIDKKNFDAVFNLLDNHFKEKLKDDFFLSFEDFKLIKENQTHPRYGFMFNYLIDFTESTIIETKETLKDIFNEVNLVPKTYDDLDTSEIENKISFVKNSNPSTPKHTTRKDYNYELGKILSKKNGWYDLDWNIIYSENKDDVEIVTELNHLKTNENNDLEFYSSWHYLKQLLENKLEKDKNL